MKRIQWYLSTMVLAVLVIGAMGYLNSQPKPSYLFSRHNGGVVSGVCEYGWPVCAYRRIRVVIGDGGCEFFSELSVLGIGADLATALGAFGIAYYLIERVIHRKERP
jgi:hypothetical protein